MNRVLTTTIAALFLAGTSAAFAQTTTPTPTTQPTPTATPIQQQQGTTGNDAYNHGSAVSQTARDRMDQTDGNHGQEVRNVATTQRDFMQFDADKNGSLSQAELASDTRLTTNFSTLDENGDGILSRDEFNGHLDLDSDVDDMVEDEE